MKVRDRELHCVAGLLKVHHRWTICVLPKMALLSRAKTIHPICLNANTLREKSKEQSPNEEKAVKTMSSVINLRHLDDEQWDNGFHILESRHRIDSGLLWTVSNFSGHISLDAHANPCVFWTRNYKRTVYSDGWEDNTPTEQRLKVKKPTLFFSSRGHSKDL